MKQKRSLLLVLAALALVGALWLGMFLLAPKQETLDQRVHDIGEQLKCPICQGESVADSPSLLAQEMRGVIRQQLQEGKSEQEVVQYFAHKYGEQIVWSPSWQGFSLLAWLAPIGLLLVRSVLTFFTVRDWRALTSLTPPNSLHRDAQEGEELLMPVDETELAQYRAQLEEELAADDPLFAHDAHGRTEVH